MADDMDVDEVPKTKERKEKDSGKARFEVKKVNALEFIERLKLEFVLSIKLYSGMLCPFGRGVRFLLLIVKGEHTNSPWLLDIVVDNCAICRNHIMDLCMLLHSLKNTRWSADIFFSTGIDCQANQVMATSEECNAAWGICNVRSFFSVIAQLKFFFTYHPLACFSLPLYL